MLQLQSLHNKAAKIILDLPIGSSASEALNRLKWKTLARRRAEHRATFIYKCLNNLFSHRFNIEFNKDKHDYDTRCKNNPQPYLYVITCTKCKQQYVGETSNCIRIRANQHRSDITTGNKNIPTVRHFRTFGIQHFQLTVVERVRWHDVETRRMRENFWFDIPHTFPIFPKTQ